MLPQLKDTSTPPELFEFRRYHVPARNTPIVSLPFPSQSPERGTSRVTDATDPTGWRRLLWKADATSGRGWLIPERLTYADVVEFGSDPTGAHR